MPEHWIHSVIPRLMLAHLGSGWPQSQHVSFPAIVMTFCKAPSPFRPFSLVSDSKLPVDGDDFLSNFCQTHCTVITRILYCSDSFYKVWYKETAFYLFLFFLTHFYQRNRFFFFNVHVCMFHNIRLSKCQQSSSAALKKIPL